MSARGARLQGAWLVSSNLSHANLSRASLHGADLTMAVGQHGFSARLSVLTKAVVLTVLLAVARHASRTKYTHCHTCPALSKVNVCVFNREMDMLVETWVMSQPPGTRSPRPSR